MDWLVDRSIELVVRAECSLSGHEGSPCECCGQVTK